MFIILSTASTYLQRGFCKRMGAIFFGRSVTKDECESTRATRCNVTHYIKFRPNITYNMNVAFSTNNINIFKLYSIPGLYFINFRLFSQEDRFTANNVKNDHSRDSNSQPLDHLSPHLTTKPRLLQ